jgi:THAP4-like, heme-binding beta-barrel domain
VTAADDAERSETEELRVADAGDDDSVRSPGSADRAVAAAVERAKVTAARNIPVFDDLPVPADTANLREGANLNDALLALLPLVGVWRGEGEGRGADGDYRFGQQIVVSHDGGDYLNWESRSWRVTDTGDYQAPDLRETGYWRFVNEPDDPSESQAIELLLAHSAGYVELFYGRPLNQSSWELATDALARSRSGVLVGGAKRLYGIVEGGDLAYVEERVDADGGLVPHLSARLSRFVG